MTEHHSLKQIRYYSVDVFILGKRGETYSLRDIFLFHKKEKRWKKLTVHDELWKNFSSYIGMKSRSLSEKDLKALKIPLIEDTLEDVTKAYYESNHERIIGKRIILCAFAQYRSSY